MINKTDSDQGKERYLYADVLRSIAIILVVIVHTGQYGSLTMGLPNVLVELINNSARGVQLFFIVSAFTIYLTYSSRKVLEKNYKSNFFIRRFFRIAPVFYLAIPYYLLQNGFGPRYWLGDVQELNGMNIISSILFLHGLNPYWINSLVPGSWSIGIEMSFYLFIPIIFKYINSTKRAVIFFYVAVIVQSIMKFILIRNNPIGSQVLWNEYLFLYLPGQLPYFILGIIFYFLVFKQKSSKYVYVLLTIIPIVLIERLNISLVDTKNLMWGVLFFGLAILSSKYLKTNLFTKVLAYVGKISYSMYIIHFAVLYWLDRFKLLDWITISGKYTAIANFSLRFLIVILITIILSSLSYKYIEKPFIKLGNLIINKRENLG